MISRRDFLKVAGASAFVVATAGMMTGCSEDIGTTMVPKNIATPAFDVEGEDGTYEWIKLEKGSFKVEQIVRCPMGDQDVVVAIVDVGGNKDGVSAWNFQVQEGANTWAALNTKIGVVGYSDYISNVLRKNGLAQYSAMHDNGTVPCTDKKAVCFMVDAEATDIKLNFYWDNNGDEDDFMSAAYTWIVAAEVEE